MAYGVLYEFRRTSTNGADILITISQRDYEGEVKKRSLGRAPVIKRENNGHIYGTSCELYAECLIDGEFSQLYTSDAYEFRVEVYRNDSLLWMGFVSPELYSEPDVAPPYDVQIIATDGLGELKNFNFENRGVASMLSHINYLMGKTGIGMALNIVSELRYVDDAGVASADKGVLDFKINLDHEEGSTCYDVLQNLLSSINANITQYNGRYLIFRETDFINKTTEEGVEGFDVNGSAVSLPVASFGSMNKHKWWPVGQLSTVIEPAKNKLALQAPDHYKDNVLDFDDWTRANAASFNEEAGVYILPDEGSNITQTIDFEGVEVGYRLGLRVRARNVGSSEDEQNIGIKVEIEGRSYSTGGRYWLVKSSGTSSGRQLTDYMWRNVDDYIEEELPLPSDADTDSDAQDIDIVLPLYRNGSRSYVYAKNVKLTIFNPAGIHDIYVYDVSLVKYEQIEGYEADVVINNGAREEGGDIELTMSAGDRVSAAGKVFMTGIPLLPSGSDPIKQWQVGDGNHQDYLSVMAYDYSRAIALPKMKYAGVLNVPGETVSVPLLFLRDGTYYFPKTYSYDIYNDELEIELISISAADVSLSSVIISQMAQSSGNMGGLTTSGSGGGGVVSLPRDKEMSDTSDNAVENKVIKAYVDGKVKSVVDLLASMWYIDDDGNVRTKHNVVIEGDTSSGGEGEDTPSVGLDEEQLQAYLDEHRYVTEDDIAGLIPDVDLSDYYTSEQTDSAISTAIANLINGAPTTLDTLKEIADALAENEDVVEALEAAIGTKANASDVYTKTQIDAEFEDYETALSTKAAKSDLTALTNKHNALQDDFDLLESTVNSLQGTVSSHTTNIGTLQGYFSNGIAKKATADASGNVITSYYTPIATHNALATRVGAAETNITNLTKNKADKATTLSGYGITNAYTKTEIDTKVTTINNTINGVSGRVMTLETWKSDISKYITIVNGNVKISTNLIVTGDTSSGGSGEDTGAEGTVTGVLVGTTKYESVSAGLLNLTSLMNLYTPVSTHNNLAGRVTALEDKATAVTFTQTLTSGTKIGTITIDGVAKNIYTPTIPTNVSSFTNDKGYLTGITKSMVDNALGGTASSNANKFLMCTGSTTVWSAIPTKLSQFTDDVVSGKYLLLAGGTITGTNFSPLHIKSGSSSYAGLGLRLSGSTYSAYFIYKGDTTWAVTDENWTNEKTLLHSGNYSSYALPKSGGTISSDSYVPLTLDTTSTQCRVQFKVSGTDKALVGYHPTYGSWLYNYASSAFIGVYDDGTPHYNGNTLIHSGNIGSQSVSHATTTNRFKVLLESTSGDLNTALAAGGVARNYNGGLSQYTNAPSGAGYGMVLELRGSTASSLAGQLAWDVNHGSTSDVTRYLWWRASDSPNGFKYGKWHQIAFTDSNVASATKLATARTIWGQSFDGTGNVTGNITLGKAIGANLGDTWTDNNGNTHPWYGLDFTHIGTWTTLSSYFGLVLKTASGSIYLNSSGNVGIGTSSPSSKLSVHSNATSALPSLGALATEYTIEFGNSGKYGTYLGTLGSGNGFIQQGRSDGTATAYNLLLQPLGGNVGIGTSSPKYKLHVNGVTKVSALRTAYIGIDCDADGNTSGYGSEINRFGSSLYLQTREGNLYLSHSAGTTYISGLASITGAVTMSNELFLGNNKGIYFKNASGTNVLAMYVNTSNVLQVGYNNVDSVAFQKPVTMSSTLSVNGGVITPALYGGTKNSYNWRLISDVSTNAIWLQAGLTDKTSESGSLWLSGLNATVLTDLHLYATETITRTLRPSSNSSYTLGTSSYRWSTIYGTHGNFSASVTATTSVVTPLLQASGGLDIVANGSAAGSRLFLTSNCFRPWGDDSKLIDLGSSSVQWRNLYAVGATFSGDVTINGNLIVKGDTSSGGTAEDTSGNGETMKVFSEALLQTVNGTTKELDNGMYSYRITAAVGLNFLNVKPADTSKPCVIHLVKGGSYSLTIPVESTSGCVVTNASGAKSTTPTVIPQYKGVTLVWDTYNKVWNVVYHGVI